MNWSKLSFNFLMLFTIKPTAFNPCDKIESISEHFHSTSFSNRNFQPATVTQAGLQRRSAPRMMESVCVRKAMVESAVTSVSLDGLDTPTVSSVSVHLRGQQPRMAPATL